MLKGLVTYCAPQSLTSFKSSKDALRDEGVDIHLVRFRELHPRSWPLALARDLNLLRSLAFGRWDFVILNSGASFLVRPALLRLCLSIAEKRGIPTFFLWRNAIEKFASIEKRIGKKRLDRAFAWLRDPRVQHLAISDRTSSEIERVVGCAKPLNIRNCRKMPERFLEITSPDATPVILNVASINHRKAPDRFVATALKVCARNLDAHFHWVGGAAPDDLQKQIDDAGLADRIRFIAHSSDPFSHMQKARCLFLTSREEAFGLVLAETMACSRTVICFSGTGAAEVPGETGRVFEWEDEDGLVAYLDKIARTNPDEAINRSARQRYLDLYSPQAYARTLLSILPEGG